MLYLPLDKLMANTANTSPVAQQNASSASASSAQAIAEEALETQRTRDAFRSRDREQR